MSFKKIIKEENASKDAHTLGDLIRNFNIELKSYPPELLDIFPTDDKYNIIYDKYHVVESEGNTVHVFNGSAIGVPESPEYTIMLDLFHSRVYYIGESNVNNSIHEYDIRGDLLDAKDYGLKKINADEFIRTHFIDYHCMTINDLLVNFNLDFELSDKLREHKIDYNHDVVFNEYFVKEYEGNDYYIFHGSFYCALVTPDHAPIYYIDPVNQRLYELCRGVGISVTVYDSNDEVIKTKTIRPDDCYADEFDIGKIIDSDK
ncbi:MAG: hypothetical protein IJI98_04580 [Methanosphaera sp.]|nr:hypothetical protein [Methanosphaera sp.]